MAWDPAYYEKFLVDHTYVAGPEFEEYLDEIVARVHGTERGKDRDPAHIRNAFRYSVFDFALADRFGLEVLDYQRFAADVRTPEGCRIDLKHHHQSLSYWETNPKDLSNVFANMHNIEAIITADYVKEGSNIFHCRFKMALDPKTLENEDFYRLSNYTEKAGKGEYCYHHRAAHSRGRCVYRTDIL